MNLSLIIRRTFSSRSISSSHYDVVISGGGMVGLTLASALANSSYLSKKKVLVLEAGNKKSNFDVSNEYSNRVSSISHDSASLLHSVGVWESLEKSGRVCEVKGMYVWHDNPADTMCFFQDSKKSPSVNQSGTSKKSHMFILENDLLVSELNEVAEKKSDHVDIIHGAKLSDVIDNSNDNQASLHLKISSSSSSETSDSEISANLLIGADGGRSVVRKQLLDSSNLTESTCDYKYNGLVATLTHSQLDGSKDLFAWQKFTNDGPIALLPLSQTVSSLVWSLPTSKSQHLKDCSESDFLHNLTEALSPHYVSEHDISSPSNFQSVSSRATFPLGLMHSPKYVGNKVALVGDACHRCHPLAGQGLNLGLSDVRCLVECLEGGVRQGAKFAHTQYCLERYETQQMRHNLPTIFATDFLHRVYTSRNPVVSQLKDLGVRVVRNVPFIKQFMYNQANYH